MLVTIFPKADVSIPQEQKEILFAIGSWLKKYGEVIYKTRALEIYGKKPTQMGAAHGVFIAPAEGTANDIRYFRSKDNTTLYAILLGWETDQNKIQLQYLSSQRIDLKNFKSVELIDGESSQYQPLSYQKPEKALIV